MYYRHVGEYPLYNACIPAQVYSHVGNSLRVDLYDTTSQEDIFINEVLVKEGHAVHCEEPYPSKVSLAIYMQLLAVILAYLVSNCRSCISSWSFSYGLSKKLHQN